MLDRQENAGRRPSLSGGAGAYRLPVSGELDSRRRQVRRAVILATGFYLAVLVACWGLYLDARGRYARQLEQRLRAIAVTAAESVGWPEVEALRYGLDPEGVGVRSRAARLVSGNGLEGLFLVDVDGYVLHDTRIPAVDGEPWIHLGADTTACAAALDGNASVGPLRQITGEWFQVAVAPVRGGEMRGEGPVIAALGVDASAGYLEALTRFRGILWGLGLSSALALVLVLKLLHRSIDSLIRAQAYVRETEEWAWIGRLAPGIAHEIRNPLEVIRGTADLIRRKYAPSDHPDEIFGFVSHEVARIERLVREFLGFSRPPGADSEEVELASLVDALIQGLQARLAEAEVRVETNILAPRVWAEPDRLEQVLLNLLGNAIDGLGGNAAQGAERRIEVSSEDGLWAGGTATLIRVVDNGPGIPEDELSRVFEPFFTTKRRGGTGLGLALSRKIARDHSGDLWAEARAEPGAAFVLVLPRPMGLRAGDGE